MDNANASDSGNSPQGPSQPSPDPVSTWSPPPPPFPPPPPSPPSELPSTSISGSTGWPQNPAQSAPDPIPPQPEPVSGNQSWPEPNQTWPSPPQGEPASSTGGQSPWFTPQQSPLQTEPVAAPTSIPTFPPVDNPLAEQPQQPASNPLSPGWGTTVGDMPSQSAESVPTDLSHLITDNKPDSTPSVPTDNLVVPPVNNNTTETPNTMVENHKGFPRWLLGFGIGLIVLVAGASAYFILGIGQNKTPSSVPAEVAPESAEVKPPSIPAFPQSTEQPAATGSANFGEIEGGEDQIPQATSSMELIRQRQGR